MEGFTRFGHWLLNVLRYPAGWPREWPVGLISAVIILALTWMSSWLLVNFAAGMMRKLAARTTTDLDDKILAVTEKPLRRLLHIVGVYFAIGVMPFPPGVDVFLTGLVLIAGVFVAVKVVTQVFMLLVFAYGQRIHGENQQRFEKDYVPLLSKVMGTVLTILGMISVLHHFGQNVTSLIAALGVGGAAIGFAAKETLGHMIAGFAILVDRPFRPGDRIKLASGEIGDVIEVGTRSTRLKLFDNNMLIVPNSELTNTRLINYNFPNHALRASIEVGVAYGTDVEAAKAAVLEVIRAQPEVLTDPAPVAFLTQFGDSALNLMGAYTISEFADSAKVQDRVRSTVYRRFQTMGVKIPYPTREVIHVNAAPPA